MGVDGTGAPERSRRWPYAVCAVAVLVAGAVIASLVGAGLGIRAHPAKVPSESTQPARSGTGGNESGKARLPLRLIDQGAVGFDADPGAFAGHDDYNLGTSTIASALLDHPPWIDHAALARISAQFRHFVDHALAYGYNGIVLDGFLQYVTFDGVGDGHAVYHRGDPHLSRARAMRAAFGPIWRYAHRKGMKVFFSTDMLALSGPLERYLDDLAGLDTSSPELWSVYRAALHELFTTMPYVDGLMIRIGEGGSDYTYPGSNFYSEIRVRTVPEVRAMLTALLRQADVDDRDIIFRTWSVGVGAVGDMHTNPRSYHRVLDGIDDDHLIVSTKYTSGDFYSHLPLNRTLFTGSQKRIVEFQSRREFEGFGALPDDLGPLSQQALKAFLARNPHVVGIWNWSQSGGPLRAGPRTLYLRTGFWQMWDVNVYLIAQLALDPDLDVARATRDWIRQTLATEPATVSAIARVLALSRQAINQGLYISPYADKSVKALGLEPPPMMWIFEWNIVGGDSATLDTIYRLSRSGLAEAIRDGSRAVRVAERMHRLVARTPASGWLSPRLRRGFVAATAYEVDLMRTLGAYRTMVLRHAQWLDTGSDTAETAWHAARTRFRAAVARHENRYGHDLAHPAYNFTAAEIGMQRADRDETMAWLARGLFAVVLIGLLLGSAPGQRLLRGSPGSAGLRALWLGATRPWRLGSVRPDGRLDRALVWLLPLVVVGSSRAVFTWFLAPAHLVLVLGAWLVFGVTLRWLARGRDRFWLSAAVGGAALVRTIILLLALVRRGPGRYWYDFWVEPGLRSFYITVAFAAFCWVLVVAWLTVRDLYGLSLRRTAGVLLTAAGAPLTLLGALVSGYGLERALTIWNDQMALLPWGLSRILGITTYLGIPTVLPEVVTGVGLVLAAAGLVLVGRRARAVS